jgi:ABC-type phosphate transport system permease subunit
MNLVNWICGIFALAMLIVFLGKYAVSIGSLPLWIIIVGVLILPVVDVVLSIRDSDDSGESSGSS